MFTIQFEISVCLSRGGGGGGGGGERRGLGPRNDVLTTCKAVNSRASQRHSKAAVCHEYF